MSSSENGIQSDMLQVYIFKEIRRYRFVQIVTIIDRGCIFAISELKQLMSYNKVLHAFLLLMQQFKPDFFLQLIANQSLKLCQIQSFVSLDSTSINHQQIYTNQLGENIDEATISLLKIFGNPYIDHQLSHLNTFCIC